jgi:EAL domain-containing protein (putative c-di-GMP-specific phosphodiesterase class I)
VFSGPLGSGLRLALDDFGSGFSSLGELTSIPASIVKIDRSLIAAMIHDQRSDAVVRALIRLVRSLGMTPIAEGIEHLEQERSLRRSGCHLGQGFLYAKPGPASGIPAVISRSEREPPTTTLLANS